MYNISQLIVVYPKYNNCSTLKIKEYSLHLRAKNYDSNRLRKSTLNTAIKTLQAMKKGNTINLTM
jgi:hypothetical protein